MGENAIYNNIYTRLNKITIIYYMIQWIYKINFPIYLFYKSDNDVFSFDKLILITISIQIIAFMRGLLTWISFKYYVKDENIFLTLGLMNKKQYMLNRECVQNVKINSKVFLSLVNSKQLEIELYGNKEFKKIIKFVAISENTLKKIYSLLMKDKSNNNLSENIVNNKVTWKISKRNMIFAALTSSFWITVPISIYLFLDDFVDLLDFNLINGVYDWFINSVLYLRIWNMLLIVVSLGIISIVIYFTKYWGFTITKDECNLKISYGAILKKELVLNCENIISMGLYTPIIRNILGATSIFIEGENNSSESISLTIFPIIKQNEAKAIIENWLNFNSINSKEIKLSYITLIVKIIRNLCCLAIINLMNMKFLHLPIEFILCIAFTILIIWPFYQFKNIKFCYLKDIIIFKKCLISKREVYLPREQIHCFQIIQNKMQKKLNLSSLKIFYLANNCEKVLKAKNISSKDAEKFVDYILNRGE